MIDVQQVRELIELMVEHDLGEIRVKEGDTAISLRKGQTGQIMMSAPQAAPVAMPVAEQAALAGTTAVDPDEGLIPLPSPMVGTFYTAPDPDSPLFVSVGQEISENSTICIIEAMKVFNEIKAEIAGTVERLCVQNAEAVEFGQPLMMIRPKS